MKESNTNGATASSHAARLFCTLSDKTQDNGEAAERFQIWADPEISG